MVKLRLLGAVVMLLMGYTNYRTGLSTLLDMALLSMLVLSTLGGAALVSVHPRHMSKAAMVNGSLFLVYFLVVLLTAVRSNPAETVFAFGSGTQFIPCLYVALFVLLDKHAALVSWAIYAMVAGVCIHGLWLVEGAPSPQVRQQMFLAVLTAHPCCILALSFMNHLRDLIEDAQCQSAKAKEQFLAMISHELRSPLQTIVSSLDVFEAEPTAPAGQRAMGRIRSAATLLDTQIRDLTALTRLELSPALRLNLVDLRGLLGEVAQLHDEQALRRGLSLSVQAPDHAMWAQADTDRLKQIIDNLVSNALKYTSDGSVFMGLAFEADGMTHLWVKDTGRGMSADRLEQAFEPFVRIKATPQERIQGSGLGLAVVRHLVGLMKGSLHVESTLGTGTTVHVRLPLPIPLQQGEGPRQR